MDSVCAAAVVAAAAVLASVVALQGHGVADLAELMHFWWLLLAYPDLATVLALLACT